MMPTMQNCTDCHHVKGSHVAIHKLPQLDMEKAMEKNAHPTTDKWAISPVPPLPRTNIDCKESPEYTGAYACATCHKGPERGYQFSKWRMSPHAQAYAALATPEAYSIAEKRDLKDPPQTSRACLKCPQPFIATRLVWQRIPICSMKLLDAKLVTVPADNILSKQL